MDNLRQGVKEYQASVKDNFALVLPVYNYGDKAASGKISQYADVALKKASKTIQKHSMVFNRKENVNWIDDAYLLMGEAYFYKQDYGMARRTFEFIIKTYNENPIKYDAMLWLANSNIQLGDYNRAEPMLDMLQNKINTGDAPEKFETGLNLSYAQFYILQKNYDAAVPYLNEALQLKPDSKMKTRIMFILGQIAQKNGDCDRASAYYKSVLKRNPSFDLEFNSQINLAQCYSAQSGDKEYITKKLNRMLKEDKNKEVLDQIYYALAQISLKDADTAGVITNLTRSVSASKGNDYQKAISSLQLADIYFGYKNYKLSQAYYDSTMQFLPKDYANYKEIEKKTNTLTDLVTNLETIQLQDSLQKLASMTEAQQLKVIDGIISKILAEEIKKQQEEMQRRESQNANLFGQDQPAIPSVGDKSGKWYFYNPTAMSNGFTNFTRKFGRRKLEDLWFLSDKTVTSFEHPEGEDTTALAGDTTLKKKALGKKDDPKSRDYYLKDIPDTPERIAASNVLILDAYYKTGFIYADGLGDYANGIKSFETLLERFPGSKYEVPTDYELFILYSNLQNDPKSDMYRNLILTRYPESDYAKLLVNPSYFSDLQSKASEASKLYEETYTAFTNQQYYMVLNNADIARASYKNDSVLMPKFDYLRALALGKIEVVDSLVIALQNIIKTYPKSDVKPLAENVLSYLNTKQGPQGQGSTPGQGTPEEPELKLYTYFPNSIHFYVLIVDGSKEDVNALKVKISDFNNKTFSTEELQVNSLLLDNNQELITVSNFDGADQATNYYRLIKTSKYIFTKLDNDGDYADFVISVENYPIFYRNKNISQYEKFFEKYYPVNN
jgi:TolA-binding protein